MMGGGGGVVNKWGEFDSAGNYDDERVVHRKKMILILGKHEKIRAFCRNMGVLYFWFKLSGFIFLIISPRDHCQISLLTLSKFERIK